MNFKDAAWIVTGIDVEEKEFWERRELMKEKWMDQEEEETEDEKEEDNEKTD